PLELNRRLAADLLLDDEVRPRKLCLGESARVEVKRVRGEDSDDARVEALRDAEFLEHEGASAVPDRDPAAIRRELVDDLAGHGESVREVESEHEGIERAPEVVEIRDGDRLAALRDESIEEARRPERI